MMRWTTASVAAALGVPAPAGAGGAGGAGGVAFSAVSTDTRRLVGGELFVALSGDHFDAHDFLADARQRGAAAAVVRRGTAPVDGLPFFPVADPRDALGRLARARRRALPVASPVVAVTGSSGKTSVKEMLRAALGARWRGRVHATTGNLNNLVGVPLTILDAPEDTAALVVEAGASVPGEIAALRAIIEPTIGVITNVGHAHVEGFGSFAGVLREKLSLLDGVPVAVVGTEPPELAVEARRRTRTVVAGTAPEAGVRPDAATLDDDGHPVIRWLGHEVTLPVVGFHQIENAMLALAAAREAGVEPAPAMAALAGVRLPPGRGAIVQTGGLTVIDDSYNANPESLHRAVEFASWLAARRRRPLALVVGTMQELGPESDRWHAEAAREIAGLEPSPVLIAAVGDLGTALEAHRAALGDRLIVAPDAEALGPRLRAALAGDEVVLLKASRGVALERVLPFLT